MSAPLKPKQPKSKEDPPLPPAGILNALDNSVNDVIPWVIDKLLAEGEQMLVFGAPKVGKSHFALQLAMAVALGKSFLGWNIDKPRKVIYLNFEMGNRFFMLRVARHFLYAQNPPETWATAYPNPESSDEFQRLKGEDDPPPSPKLLNEVNKGIKGRLYFSDGLRKLEVHDILEKGETFQKNSDREGSLVKYWHGIMDMIKPDLIIFDTLSKSHSVNESDNSEIKDVLLRLRKISSVKEDGSQYLNETGMNTHGRKEIAHIIIHHARKLPDQGKSNYVNLDNIRGGSAIRAEADLIFGLFERRRGKGSNRTITMESRNHESRDMVANFSDCFFQDVASDNSGKQKSKPSREQLENAIKKVYVDKGVRGIPPGMLNEEVTAEFGKIYKKKQIKDWIIQLTDDPDFFLKKLEKKKIGNLKEFPVEINRSACLYWIEDDSPWLRNIPSNTQIDTP